MCSADLPSLVGEAVFEVDCPTIIRDQGLMDAFALSWICHADSDLLPSLPYLENNPEFRKFSTDMQRRYINFSQREANSIAITDDIDVLGDIQLYGQLWLEASRPVSPQALLNLDRGRVISTLSLGQTSSETGFTLKSAAEVKKSMYDDSDFRLPLEGFTLKFTDRSTKRWKMAWRALQSEKQFRAQNKNYLHLSDDLFVRYAGNRPGTRDLGSLPVALGFGIAALVYGGLHALAWFAHFKSPVERLLWRLSACIVMVGIPLMFLLDRTWRLSGLRSIIDSNPLLYNLGFAVKESRPTFHYYRGQGRRYTMLTYIHLLIAFLVLVAYGLARAYLVVKCFMQLSHMPAGVYDTPSWSAYFPHIS